MPHAISDLIRSLFGSREGVLPSIQAFPALDVEQIARDLRLDLRAKENGKLNQPSQDSEVKDTAEADVDAEIERRGRKASEDYRSQLNLYDSRIRRALISTDQRALIDAAGENALTDFKVQAIDDLNHLHNALSEVEGRQRDYDAFRVANGLTRLPDLVSPRERTVRGLLLAIFVVSESIVNGLLFAEGSETGLIGGVSQAMILAILNVGVAVLYARFGLPFVRHIRLKLRIVGIGATVLFAFWAIGFNLLVGHFRDIFIANAGQVPMTELISRLTAAPLMLFDAKSSLLALLGFFVTIASLVDASGMDDKYFGYRDVGRRREEAVSAYADAKTSCLAGLTQRRDSAIEDMSNSIELVRTQEFDYRLAVDGRTRLHENYRAYMGHLTDSYIRLLQRYREANISPRTTPPPARFQQRPNQPDFLADPRLPELPTLGEDTRVHVIERMQHFIRAINQQFEIEVNHYQTVATLTEQNET